MKKYCYKGKNIYGQEIKGNYVCNSVEELYYTIRNKGFFLTYYREINSLKSIVRKKVSLRDIYEFCEQLYELITSGIPIVESLNIINYQCTNQRLKESVNTIKEELQQGKSLYESMSGFKDIFPVFLTTMVKVGEESGNLEGVFKKLHRYYYYKYEIKKKLVSSLIYPIFVFITTICMTVFLIMKVVPAFTESIMSMGVKLPLITVIFMKIFNKSFLVLFPIILILILFLLKSNKNLQIIDKIKFKMPIVRTLFYKKEEIKYVQSLSILLNSGVNITKSLDIIIKTTDNYLLKNKYSSMLEKINKGMGIADSIKEIEIFQPFVVSMIASGEVSGKLDSALKKIETIIKNDFKDVLERVLRLIEPIMIILVSVFVGFTIISIFLPIMNMTSIISM
ncbi:type II secretion system F family protein [Haloimpatiens sp. FM7330]|uniref:type II secretion system F family protein n=1 Tax=Haloimpatiens sp. FM7330 TaxID=3298610 RepID=UPI00362DB470